MQVEEHALVGFGVVNAGSFLMLGFEAWERGVWPGWWDWQLLLRGVWADWSLIGAERIVSQVQWQEWPRVGSTDSRYPPSETASQDRSEAYLSLTYIPLVGQATFPRSRLFQIYWAGVTEVTSQGPKGAKRLEDGEAVDGVSTCVPFRSAQRERMSIS